MGKPTGFIELGRRLPERRSVGDRLQDFRELEGKLDKDALKAQASRCMDCGVPFCHQGCPLGNLIPEWNEHVYQGDAAAARAKLLATNNFPEITGRVCPAPCEAACVLTGVGREAVSIKQIEKQIADTELYAPQTIAASSGFSVGIVGSGPAGLAAAQQLARWGHAVTVYERADAIGGLMRYGIPGFKLERGVLDKRLEQLRSEGVRFVTGHHVTALDLPHDATILATGASQPRDLPIEGRKSPHVVLAMDYLTAQQKGTPLPTQGKRVVVLGGGDTGSDCLGTALRLGAASVTQLELMPRPPDVPENPWPQWPLMFRTSSSQEEGGDRLFAVVTKRFGSDHIEAEQDGTPIKIPADLVVLALGFTGVESDFGVGPFSGHRTSRRDVFVCGDAKKGASLVVWAIAEGRSAATEVHRALLAGECQRLSSAEQRP